MAIAFGIAALAVPGFRHISELVGETTATFANALGSERVTRGTVRCEARDEASPHQPVEDSCESVLGQVKKAANIGDGHVGEQSLASQPVQDLENLVGRRNIFGLEITHPRSWSA
jgi:hypothetical protein